MTKLRIPTFSRAMLVLVLAGNALVALVLTAWVAPRIGRSHVDVALDVAAPLAAPPVVSYGAGASGKAIAMARVPDRFAQPVSFFELQATHRHNPASKGYNISLNNFSAKSDVSAGPPTAWKLTGWGNWAFQGWRPAASGSDATTPTLRWRGPVTDPTLRLTRDRWSGIVKLTTSEGTCDVDLYDPAASGSLAVPLPVSGCYARYVASVPRQALGGLRFEFASGGQPDIRRLYVGSFVPTIGFTGPTAWPPQVWGAIATSCVPPPPSQPIVLPSLSLWEQGHRRTWAAVWAAAMAALLGLEAAGWCAWRLLGAAAQETVEPGLVLAPWSWRVFLGFLLSAWVVWGAWLAAFWPASVCPDAWEQWGQMLSGKLQDTHPPLFALTMWGLTRLWFTPSVVSLAQMAALGVACAWGFAWLVRARVPRWAIVAAWVALLLSPTVGFLAVAVVKDTFYSAVVMALIVLSAGLALEPVRRRGWGYWAGFGVLLALVPLYRFNGLLVAPLFAGLLWVAVRPTRRGLGGACALAVMLFALVQYGLFGWLHVEHSPFRFGTIYPAWTTAGILTNAPPLSGKDAEFLNSLRPLQEDWDYSAIYSSGAIYARPGGKLLDIALASKEQARFWRVLGRLCERNPGLALHHLWLSTDYLYRIPRHPGLPEQVLAVQACMMPESYRRNGEAHGFPPVSLFPSALNAAVRWLPRLALDPDRGGVAFGWIIWRPALRLYLVLAAACVVWWRLRRPRLLLPFAPVFLNTVSLAAGLSSETRYQLPLFLATGFLLCLTLIPRRPDPNFTLPDASRQQ